MTKLTVRDLLDGKGGRQFTFVQVTRRQEAIAAAEAGMDMIGTGWIDGRKEIAGSVPETHFAYGLQYGHHASAVEALRAAFSALAAGAHSIYCPMSPNVIEVLAREGVPVIAHVGLVPPKATWSGGMRAVGKTADQAIRIYREIKAYESAGAFAVEIEVVPHRVASEISNRIEGSHVRVRRRERAMQGFRAPGSPQPMNFHMLEKLPDGENTWLDTIDSFNF
jgi:3-methyl-2-oxobutanoate hydroxymethyltransferase